MPMPPPINAFAPENLNMLSRGLSMLTDPFTIARDVGKQSVKEYGWKERVDGKGDAFRHLVGTAMLAQKHGAPYAEFVTSLHESPYLPFFGAMGHSKEAREMDLYNNKIGLELATQAKDYNDLLNLARQYIDTGKARTMPSTPPK